MTSYSIEIDRSPEDVFAYLDQLDRHGEWQSDIKKVVDVTPGPVHVGTRATDYRKVPLATAKITYEITEHEPPRKVSFVGVNGPMRPHGTVTIEPLDGGTRSRMTLEFELVGHGLGKLFAGMANKRASTQIPEGHRALKARLESGA